MVVRRLLLVSLLTASFVAGGSDGVIEGKVVSLTGRPLNKAEVTLSYGKTASGAVTDSAGKFVFDELDPGEYYLSADHFGYLDNSDERTPLIRLAAGQHRKDIVLTLTPQGILAGRVLDEDGDPVPKAQISFQRYAALGVKKPAESESFEVDGEAAFKFTGLRPGRYYLSAIPKDPYERTDGDEGFVTTYYPNAIREEAATAIVLAPGAEMRNIEIRLRKARLFRVRGKVNGLGPGSGYSLILMADRHIAYDAQIKPDGTFTFDSVLPGSYTIKTGVSRYERRGDDFYPRGSNGVLQLPCLRWQSKRRQLVIAASPVEDLAGRIKMDPPIPRRNGRWLSLLPRLFRGMESLRKQRYRRRRVRLSSLPPDEYRVQLQTLPEGMYLKSIRYEGQEVANAKIDLIERTAARLKSCSRRTRLR